MSTRDQLERKINQAENNAAGLYDEMEYHRRLMSVAEVNFSEAECDYNDACDKVQDLLDQLDDLDEEEL